MAHNLLKLVVLSTALVSAAHAQNELLDFTPKLATVGLHLHTLHDNNNFCNSTPGVYAKFSNGLTVGTYKNSECNNYSAYAGVTFEHAVTANVSVAVTAGVVTGYRLSPVLPLLVPSVAVDITNNTAVRLTFIPKIAADGANAVNFAIERRF